jgi:hypothetical protein
MDKQIKTICYYLNIGQSNTFTKNIIIDFPVSKISCSSQLDIVDVTVAPPDDLTENLRACLHSTLISGYSLGNMGFTSAGINTYNPSMQVRGDYTFSILSTDGRPYVVTPDEELFVSVQLTFYE